ncbi:hypothetical protein KKH27_14020 [bacterium]|nr:hypothetical protein [bacterium]
MGDDRLSEKKSIAKPADVTFESFAVAYCDMIPVEHFGRLEDGIVRLQRRYKSQPSEIYPGERCRKFFTTFRTATGGGAWLNAGLFDFHDGKSPPRYLKSAHIYLHQMSPSFICLQAFVFPTDAFRQEFLRLISSHIHHMRVIPVLRFLRGRMASSGQLPSVLRQEQIEHLYLLLNREFVRLLRKHVHAGWAQQGPLPSVELFFSNTDVADDKQHDQSEFWRSLTLSAPGDYIYRSGDSIRVAPPAWADKPRLVEPYRLIIDRDRYVTEHKYEGDADYFKYSLAHDLMMSLLPEIVSHLAVVCMTSRLAERTARLRERLPIGLRAPRLVSLVPSFLRSVSAGVLWLNELSFEHDRFSGEVVRDYLREKNKSSLIRKVTFGKEPRDVTLGADCRACVEHLSKYLDSQISMLKGCLQDLWSYQIQILLLGIALLALVFTALQLLPDATKTRLWNRIIGDGTATGQHSEQSPGAYSSGAADVPTGNSQEGR